MDVEQEDCRKLHSEVTQLASHRFQLTTLGIVTFAAISGSFAVLMGRDMDLAIKTSSFFSIVLLLVLGIIFLNFAILETQMRVYTAYLDIKFSSEWEQDWRAFRNDRFGGRYPKYPIAGVLVFGGLGLLAVLYPWTVIWLALGRYPTEMMTSRAAWAAGAIFVVYVLIVLAFSGRRHPNEARLIDDWRRVLHRPEGRPGYCRIGCEFKKDLSSHLLLIPNPLHLLLRDQLSP